MQQLYPEVAAGGFCRVDQRAVFYTRVNALLRSDMTVLDFGAGRGLWAERQAGYLRSLRMLKGRCHEVISADIDEAVLRNPAVDEAVVLVPGGALPFPDESIDLVVAFAVLEHIRDPEATAAELRRVLRPGGWICAGTPNRWGYIGIGARLIPSSLHAKLLPFTSPTDAREERDVFPVYYRANTLARVRRLFPDSTFRNCSYVMNGPPAYNMGSLLVARLLHLYGRVMPQSLAQYLHVFVQRR